MVCSSCGRTQEYGRFCEECGAVLKESSPAAPLLCPICQTVSVGKFCTRCGAELVHEVRKPVMEMEGWISESVLHAADDWKKEQQEKYGTHLPLPQAGQYAYSNQSTGFVSWEKPVKPRRSVFRKPHYLTWILVGLLTNILSYVILIGIYHMSFDLADGGAISFLLTLLCDLIFGCILWSRMSAEDKIVVRGYKNVVKQYGFVKYLIQFMLFGILIWFVAWILVFVIVSVVCVFLFMMFEF